MRAIFLSTILAFALAIIGCENDTVCGSDTGQYAKTFKDSFSTAIAYDSITIVVWEDMTLEHDTIPCTIIRSTSLTDSMHIEAMLSGHYLEDIDSMSIISPPLVWNSDTLSLRLDYSSTISNRISKKANASGKARVDDPLCAVAADRTKIEALRFEMPANTVYRIISYTNTITIR